jgi:death-on-curing protein
MTDYLDLEDLLEIAREAIGRDVVVRDYGLLESARARPRASVFGHDAYPDLHLKAAALLHSLARNRAPEDERFDFVIGVATGAMSDLDEIAEQLRSWSCQEG